MSLDKVYAITCPWCNKERGVTKSIFHDMGLCDFGRATCPGCKTELNLIYSPESDTMKARLYAEFLSEIDSRDKHGPEVDCNNV
jgi:phage FluMu protein Com